jgi:hypothetical protein
MRLTPDESALTIAARRVDDRLTALCHAGVNKTVAEQMSA